jgi:glutamine cyclotransferase
MAIPFSQTLESRRPDIFRLFMAGILLTAPLAILWGWWLLTVPFPVYKTSLRNRMTNFASLAVPSAEEQDAPKMFSAVVVNRYPHDRKAFTQGLAWDRGTVYSGTGLYGRSSLRQVDLKTGRVKRKIEYKQHIFAEGITVFQDSVYQLTWKNGLVFQYDKKDFSLIRSWKYPRQGWGITHDNRHLITSDGSASLYFLDPKTLAEKKRITVHDDQDEVDQLNELEYIKGSVYANVWQTERIAVINPETGAVTAWLDLTSICRRIKAEARKADVLNGIMYDPATDRLFVTGKLWPALFEIRVVPVRPSVGNVKKSGTW